VAGAAVEAVPGITGALRPEYETDAAAYADAVSKLPETLTVESLVAAGPEALAAYTDAEREAEWFKPVVSWIASLDGVFGHKTQPDLVLGVLRPETFEQLAKLDAAAVVNHDHSMRILNPVLFVAAREGVQFGMNTPHEAKRLRRQLESLGARRA